MPEMEKESQRGEGHPLRLFHGCHCVTHSPMPFCSHSQLTVGCFLLTRSILLIVRPKVIQSNEAPHLTTDTKAEGGIASATDSRHISHLSFMFFQQKGPLAAPLIPVCPGTLRQSCMPTDRRDAQPGLATLQSASMQERERLEAKLFKDTQVLCAFRQAACITQNVSVLTLTYKCYCHTNCSHESIQQQSSKFHPHNVP